MTWEQRFGALAAFDGDEWDAAHERLEQEWLAAYTAASGSTLRAWREGWQSRDAALSPKRLRWL